MAANLIKLQGECPVFIYLKDAKQGDNETLLMHSLGKATILKQKRKL